MISYTSGTTGRPKGACLPQRMLLWDSFSTILSWGLRKEDVALILIPRFHSAGFNVLLIPLFRTGGQVIFTRSFEPEQALSLIERARASVVFMVPTMFEMLAESPSFQETDFDSVRFFLISGGAPCPLDLIRHYQSRGMVLVTRLIAKKWANCSSPAPMSAPAIGTSKSCTADSDRPAPKRPRY